MNGSRLVAGFFLLLIVLTATLKTKLILGWTPDLLIALLIAFGMILSFYEVLFLAGFSAWIINWQPVPGWEIAFLVGLALISYFGRFFMPWQRWVSVILLNVGGIVGLYAISTPGALRDNLQFLFWDSAVAILFTFAVVHVFRSFYSKKISDI